MIPISIVDDFFENPDQVIDYSNSLKYSKDPDGKWPGKRSNWLHTENEQFFHNVSNKMLSVFFNLDDPNFRWEVSLAFQKVDNVFKKGWTHQDLDSIITAIVYLNKENNPMSGTSIMSKKVLAPIIPQKEKEKFILSETETSSSKAAIETLNNQFDECVSVRNKFNRLVAFPSHLYHRAQDFDNGEERLTLIAFVRQVTASRMPLDNMRKVII